jgi:hypothetical protein
MPPSVHPKTPIQVFQEETATESLMEFPPPPKLSNSVPSRVTRSIHGVDVTSSPVIQKNKLKVRHMKNNFKKMVHNPNSSNSDKNDDSDCCTECKEYCCGTKEECEWIKCSLCGKWLHENCTIGSKTCMIVDVTTVPRILKNRKKSTRK